MLVAAGGSEPREFPLRAVYGAPGTYVADFVPTRTGSYIFTFTGTIEGNPINERFESGPGRFDDVQAITTIQFPEPLPSSAELQQELAVAKAAIGTAQALAFGGLGAGAAAVLAAGMAMLMASRGARAAGVFPSSRRSLPRIQLWAWAATTYWPMPPPDA